VYGGARTPAVPLRLTDRCSYNIHAYTREFEWNAGMYDDSTLDTRLIDIESLLAGMEELDAVNSEIMPRFDDEIRSWKKRLMVKDIEKTTEDARKMLP